MHDEFAPGESSGVRVLRLEIIIAMDYLPTTIPIYMGRKARVITQRRLTATMLYVREL